MSVTCLTLAAQALPTRKNPKLQLHHRSLGGIKLRFILAVINVLLLTFFLLATECNISHSILDTIIIGSIILFILTYVFLATDTPYRSAGSGRGSSRSEGAASWAKLATGSDLLE